MSSSRGRTRFVVTVVVALVLVTAVVGVVRWQRDDRPRVEVGANLDPPDTSSRVVGLTTDLLLPFGGYRVTVGEARQELPPRCCVDEVADRRAPEGGSFVGVAVSLVPRELRAVPVAEPGTVLPSPTFTLVVEGSGAEPGTDDYPVTAIDDAWDLDTLYNRPLQVYVAVAGRPDLADVALRVDYDGVSQLVHTDRDLVETGDAARLPFSDRGPEEQPCGEVSPAAGFEVSSGDLVGCTVERERLAYVGGVGWAPRDLWVVLTVDTDDYLVLERRRGGRTESVEADDVDDLAVVGVTLSGEAPVATWRDPDGNVVGVFAADAVGSGELVVTATYDDFVALGDATVPDEVTVTWRSAL